MNKIKNSLLIVLISFMFVASIAYIITNTFIDRNISDYFLKQQTYNQKKMASDDIVLVIIDDKSVESIRWPWARTYYTDIFEFLQNTAGAKVIAFDAVITSSDSYNPEADRVFYNKLPALDKLISGFNLYTTNNNSGDILPDEYDNIFQSKSFVIE